MASNRLSWADNAKALGMLLVFWGHFIEKGAFSGYGDLNLVYRFIYAFHMPFFFLLAGYFYRPYSGRFGSLFVNKIKTRLVPAAFFNMLAILLYQKPELWQMPPEIALQAWQKTYLMLQGKPTENWPSWFLVCLFWVELVAAELIPALTTALRKLLVLPAVFLLAYWATDDAAATAHYLGTEENWWFLQEAPVALLFYVCGYFIAQRGKLLLPTERRLRSLGVGAAMFAITAATFSRNFDGSLAAVNMSGAMHGTWGWFLAAAVAGSLLMIHVGRILPRHRLIDYVGQNTLPLLGINGIFLVFLNPLLWTWFTQHVPAEQTLLLSLPAALLCLLASLPVVALFNRLIPFLIGRWR